MCIIPTHPRAPLLPRARRCLCLRSIYAGAEVKELTVRGYPPPQPSPLARSGKGQMPAISSGPDGQAKSLWGIGRGSAAGCVACIAKYLHLASWPRNYYYVTSPGRRWIGIWLNSRPASLGSLRAVVGSGTMRNALCNRTVACLVSASYTGDARQPTKRPGHSETFLVMQRCAWTGPSAIYAGLGVCGVERQEEDPGEEKEGGGRDFASHGAVPGHRAEAVPARSASPRSC